MNQSNEKQSLQLPLLSLGFRLFFLLAASFSVILISLWGLLYFGKVTLPLNGMNSFQWHAHEMIYGYSIAVIAGFLLTAVRNWTGLPTLNGVPLLLLGCLWLGARVLLAMGSVIGAASFDLVFIVCLLVAIGLPIIKVKQWKQMAVLSKLILLASFNMVFYLGALGIIENGQYLGVYGGLYLIVGLVLMMGRRLIPFFVEQSVSDSFKMRNSLLLDISSLFVFLFFFVAELTQFNGALAAYAALLLFIIHASRLVLWHTPKLWKAPLLWVLYLALWSICFGFLLLFLSYYLPISKLTAIHAMSYGGIGLITIGMMTRVTLGHTGHSVYNPPKANKIMFTMLACGVVARVVLPIILPNKYLLWIGVSQTLWIGSFLIFLWLYTYMLLQPRVDENA